MRRLDVPGVLVDETSTRILLATLSRPRSGTEISRVTGVPVAETFSRLKILQKKGLVNVASYRPDRNGQAMATYRANFADAYMFVEQGRVKVRFLLAGYSNAELGGETAALL